MYYGIWWGCLVCVLGVGRILRVFVLWDGGNLKFVCYNLDKDICDEFGRI